MNELYENELLLRRNLTDAGCDEEAIAAFTQLCKDGKTAAQLRYLEQHRRKLLTALHENQSRIDCLDYLIHQVGKKKNGERQ